MSNLSELLPAGAGAKSASFVASGTLGSGVTVALKTDGTVTAVASDANPQAIGTPVVFESASAAFSSTTYDSANNKIVIAYRDAGNSDYGTAVVGTVSGTSISFGTPVVFESASSLYISCTYDSINEKIVIAYRDAGNVDAGTAIVGTVSGDSISFGSSSTFTTDCSFTAIAFDLNAGKIVIIFRNNANSNYGTGVVGTVSGTSISFGTSVVFQSADCQNNSVVFDSSNNKIIAAYQNVTDSRKGYAVVGTISGTSISFGSSVVFQNNSIEYYNPSIVYDTNAEKVVIAYRNTGSGGVGKAIVGTVSGTSISFGSAVTFNASSTSYISASYDTSAGKVTIGYYDFGNSNYLTGIVGTVSGTSISFGSEFTLSAIVPNDVSSAYDSTNNKVVFAYQNTSNSSYGTALVFQNEGPNSADFIGITDQAIADTATGAVIVQGGVNSSNAGASIPQEYTPSSGVDFDANGPTLYISSVFDTNANKVVVFYSDYGNSQYGTAAVGTISAGVISFGSPVIFESAASEFISATFDSNSNKIVVTYRDDANSGKGTAIVGTVSGTSISFGSTAIFNNGSTRYVSSTFDSNSNKVVVAYRDDSNSDYGTATVGTVSGTSISFGSEVVFNTANTPDTSTTFDSSANKIVIAYQNVDNYGKAVVGTVSGTSISFGSAVTFNAGTTASVSSVYDPNANKTVIAYANSNVGTGIVGTVSGTSISFGTPVVFLATSTGNINTAFDSTANKVVVAYSESLTTFDGFSSVGTVSGTDISFTAGTNFTGDTSYSDSAVTYDSTANKMVFSFRNGTVGTAVVGTLSGNAFTPNTDYYVQSDGSLSTTVSSVPAGRALSSTSILLEG